MAEARTIKCKVWIEGLTRPLDWGATRMPELGDKLALDVSGVPLSLEVEQVLPAVDVEGFVQIRCKFSLADPS